MLQIIIFRKEQISAKKKKLDLNKKQSQKCIFQPYSLAHKSMLYKFTLR